MEQIFEVNITNEILGDSSRKMTMEQISKFNLCALALAKKALKEPGKHFNDGMWSVRTA